MLHRSLRFLGNVLRLLHRGTQAALSTEKVDSLFLRKRSAVVSVRLRTHAFTCGSSLHSSASFICFFSVSCCSFTQVAHGDSEQKLNLQPHTTRNILTFLTLFVKKKHIGAGIPPRFPKDLGLLPED